MSLKGVLEVQNTLVAKILEIEGATKKGLLAAGLLIETESIQRTPKDIGNLRSSAYTQPTEDGVQVGYTADYAPHVHENLESRHPIGEAKFLERAMNEKEAEALELIKQHAAEAAK